MFPVGELRAGTGSLTFSSWCPRAARGTRCHKGSCPLECKLRGWRCRLRPHPSPRNLVARMLGAYKQLGPQDWRGWESGAFLPGCKRPRGRPHPPSTQHSPPARAHVCCTPYKNWGLMGVAGSLVQLTWVLTEFWTGEAAPGARGLQLGLS